MAGEEEGQNLIVKLLVWHGIAIGVTCGEERAEKIIPSFAWTWWLFVWNGSAAWRRGPTVWSESAAISSKSADKGSPPEGRQIPPKRRSQFQGCWRQFSSKEHTADRFSRVSHHIGVEITYFAIAPLGKLLRDTLQHDGSVVGHRAVLEAWLDHVPLLPPRSTIARKQTASKDWPESSNLCGAAKPAAILHENFFNILGMTEKDNLPAQNAQLYSIAVFL
jgi:hypothetical protein